VWIAVGLAHPAANQLKREETNSAWRGLRHEEMVFTKSFFFFIVQKKAGLVSRAE
jgi:hypothetical protein